MFKGVLIVAQNRIDETSHELIDVAISLHLSHRYEASSWNQNERKRGEVLRLVLAPQKRGRKQRSSESYSTVTLRTS